MPYDRRPPSDSGRPQRPSRPGQPDSRGSHGGTRGGANAGRPAARRTGPRPATPSRARRDDEADDRPRRYGESSGRPPRRDGGSSTGSRPPRRDGDSSERPRRYGDSDGRSTTGYNRPARPGAGSARPDGARPSYGRPRGDAEPRPYGNDGRRSGAPARRDPRAARVEDGERPRRYDAARTQAGNRTGGRPGGRDRVPPRRVEPPRTTVQIRSAEVKAARGLREPRQQAEPAPWEREQWVDDGPLRSAARKATARSDVTPGKSVS